MGAPTRKRGELDSQNSSQWAQESPQAIEGGRIGPASQKWGLRGAFKLSTFLLVVADFEIEMATGEIEECSSSALPITSCHVYEFDLQCSAGDAQLGLYMSLKFAVQR